MEAKSCDAAALLVGQKLQIQQRAAAAREAGQDLLPAGLVLVAVRELDVGVLEREVLVLGQFFEA